MSAHLRHLKIETVGYFNGRKIKPLIRLSGHWLERAGFKPEHRVEITQQNAGELTLRFKEQVGCSVRLG